MNEAAQQSITPMPDLTVAAPSDLGPLQPTSCEYIAIDKVRMYFKTATGEALACTMTSAMMLLLINQSVALLNSHTGEIFRDLGLL